MSPLIGMPGTWEMVIILAIVILIFGAAKLPELARGTGQALRIFKAETKGLVDDDDPVDEDQKTPEQKAIEASNTEPKPTTQADDPIVREQRDGTTS
jgi:sec-independent protein translocase protein TatA